MGGSANGGTTGGAGSSGNGGAGGRGGSGPATPVILSVDFVGGGNGANPVPMTATESAGVVAARNWNSASGNSGSKASLVFSDGTTTSASLTWNSPANGITSGGIWRLGYTDAPGDVRMMNGYLDPGGTATVTVSNLPAAITTGGYDVYVYTYGDVLANQTRSYGYAIGTASFTVTQTGPAANPFPGLSRAADHGSGTYVLFRKVTGAAFTLTATPADRAPINGLQIVWPASP